MSMSMSHNTEAQARRRRRTSRRPRLFSTFFPFSSLIVVVLLSLSVVVKAQSRGFLNNGRFFTAALAISNSPQPGSPVHAGSDIVISIELSGDGRIPQSAFSPGSGLPTRYDSLEIYLVSTRLNTNLTVSSGPDLLTQEPGSTVKHLNWPIPNCIPPGEYNLTYYEASTINDQSFYSITPVPVTVNNPNAATGSRCPATNAVLRQPQRDSAPPVHPFLDASLVLETSRPIPSQDVPVFVPQQTPQDRPGDLPTQTIPINTDRFVSVTQRQSTLFSIPRSTATLVVVTAETLIGTSDSLEFTTTELVTNTITAVVDVNIAATGILFPVNTGTAVFPLSSMALIATSVVILFLGLS